MNRSTHLFVLLALCGFSQAQEISLFNERDLSGWSVRSGGADFRVSEGCIVGKNKTTEKKHTYLTTNTEFENFTLSFEFKVDKNVNSGVQFRSQFHDVETRIVNAKGKAVVRAPGQVYGYQFEIDTKGIANTGAIYDEGRRGIFLDDLASNTTARAAFIPGDWNLARVECVGDSIRTFVNGVPAASITDATTQKGVIALQIHASNLPGAEVRWRNIKLLPIGPGKPLASGLPPAQQSMTVQTNADQPRIEVIKDQGPNATEWALTPLDEAIPADIRQNLTFLREDLLDEGKKAAKASPQAYKLASDYCDKLLAALDQRELARVNAGYAAAQADANKNFSNSALEARRNYQMSWPQFSREESQRAALRESETNKADVKKQRLKVEWATRATQMRSYLDNLYRQLREAMR